MIAIIDFGSQFTQLIARKIRELGVYSKIYPYYATQQDLQGVEAIILSGGPCSVLSPEAPRLKQEIWDMHIPILAFCYGYQLMTIQYGGTIVKRDQAREYGKTSLKLLENSSLFMSNIPQESTVWMSHEDGVEEAPEGFAILATTKNSPVAAFENPSLMRYGLQFHPEVHHCEFGTQFFQNFLFSILQVKKDWNLSDFIQDQIQEIQQKVGSKKVICGISGGVDSSVAALIVSKAVGDRLKCIFVDHGLLRLNEGDEVIQMLQELGLNIERLNVSDLFLQALRGISDPEQKRKLIGKLFIDVFAKEAASFDADFLVQGTLYPDVIESSGGVSGIAAKIKSHHNVGGLPEKMELQLIEPLQYLFKDEVRRMGEKLGLPAPFVHRHPFPGPGLAIRIIGEVTPDRIELLQKADAIMRTEIKAYDTNQNIWQALAVLLPIKTVGVMGDERTYQNVVAIRLVESVDGMTANWHHLPSQVLEQISNRITNEVKGINRVVYDITSKPPATIEWE
ncbi:MAG: glutamine-hydrolyzing GMP synthase [Caldisericia bacterium]|nr:glutamine-hydrolyzing GMP synthase [Caldisericia bacterium]MDD4614858.1 glutamine-hydrolyzing GMP synthase [Caldisericia bacterium]